MTLTKEKTLAHLEISIFPFFNPTYWLRPIEGVQFGFDNFDSHFIRVQIFQIDFSTLLLILSASKYFRLILKGPNEHFSSSFSHYHAIETVVHQLRKDRGTSLTLLNDPNIWGKQVAQRYLQNNLRYLWSPILPWSRPCSKSLFRAFFSEWSIFSSCKKSALNETGFKLFRTLTMILAKLAFWKSYEIIFGTKSG